MNTHRTIDKLLPAFALGELEPEESSRVEAHVAECLQCRDEAVRLGALVRRTDAMRALTADEQSRALARQSVLDAVARVEARPTAVLSAVWGVLLESRLAKFAAVAALIVAAFSLLHLANQGNDLGAAFAAETLEQIEEATAITWKTTYYMRWISKDGERTWVESETQQEAYMSPGLYREVKLQEDGGIRSVTITDTVNQKELTLVPGENRAVLRGLATLLRSPDGPFAWVSKQLRETRDLQWVGTRGTPSGKVNVFRTAFWDKANNQAWSYDFWIDADTKRLVGLQVPGSDIYDPEKDPARKNPRGAEWYSATPVCSVQHDINFGAELDESLFRLEPPEGYTVKGMARPQVTEKEMVDYLGILAEYNDKTFPDQVFPFAFASDRLNKIWDKPKEERTAAEQKLLETNNYYKMASLNMMPTGHFVQDHTVENSFRYLGKGVKLGDEHRIVCWYRLKGSTSYRAVYGDLSVKDVAPEGLPLSVEP